MQPTPIIHFDFTSCIIKLLKQSIQKRANKNQRGPAIARGDQNCNNLSLQSNGWLHSMCNIPSKILHT